MTRFDLIKKEVEKILPNSPIEEELIHSRLTLKWLLKLKPDACEALKISAVSHDIDRAVNKIIEKDRKPEESYEDFKKKHSIRSANIIVNLMEKQNYPQITVQKVKKLVENHEFGGDKETNILMSADSLAYFEYNLPIYFKRNGKEATIHKIKFMFNRMSKQAQEYVKKMKYKNKEVSDLLKELISQLSSQ
jgi:hypothetical protein